MEKNIKYYIQHYIGCRCLNTWFTPEHEKYNAGWVPKAYELDCPRPYLLDNGMFHTFTDSIKPILRQMQDMTDEDWRTVVRNIKKDPMLSDLEDIKNSFIYGGFDDRPHWVVVNKALHELRKLSIDCDGLISSGLAVDEKTLTK